MSIASEDRGGHIWPASTWHRDQAMRVCGSGDVRRRRHPCRSGKALCWRAALPLGHATTFAAARWRRAHRGPRRGTSSCRDRCRSRRSQYWVSETWRAPCLWRPLPASLAGGAGARPDHPISRRRRCTMLEMIDEPVRVAHDCGCPPFAEVKDGKSEGHGRADAYFRRRRVKPKGLQYTSQLMADASRQEASMPEINTRFLFTLALEIQVSSLGDTPYGRRRMFHFDGGSFDGPKLDR